MLPDWRGHYTVGHYGQLQDEASELKWEHNHIDVDSNEWVSYMSTLWDIRRVTTTELVDSDHSESRHMHLERWSTSPIHE